MTKWRQQSKAKKCILAALLLLAAAGCGLLIYYGVIPERNYQKFLDAKPQYEKSYAQNVQQLLCESLALEDYPDYVFDSSAVTVQGSFDWDWSSKYACWIWTRNGTVTISLPTSFLALDNGAKAKLLKDLEWQCKRLVNSYNADYPERVGYMGKKDFNGNYPGVGYDRIMILSNLYVKMSCGGSVYQAKDSSSFYRDAVTVNVQKASTPSPSRSNSSKNSTAEDTYDVRDYVDVDDFYEDYGDDFFDYEDAEDYFYEHEED
jgi:hypothetical protein